MIPEEKYVENLMKKENEGRYGENKKIGKETQGIEEDRNDPRREVCGKPYEEGK